LTLPPAVLSQGDLGGRYPSIVESKTTHEAAPRRPAEELVIYLGLLGVGVIPVVFALIHGAAFGPGETLGALLMVLALVGLVR